jgi:hypothetical protein
MLVDVEVTFCLQAHVDARMASKKIEHVVQKADACRDRGRARAIKVDRDLDLGFLGFALNRRVAHFCL